MTSVSDLTVTNNLTTNTLHLSGLSRFSNDIYADAEITRNKYSHHLVTRIDSMTSMNVFKL